MSEVGFDNSAIFLGFDFGTKHIGVAVGQLITVTATPLRPINAVHGTPDWGVINKLIKLWQPTALVVGVPLKLDGSSQRITVAATEFIGHLRDHYGLPVYAAEERLTTKEARGQVFNDGGYKALTQTSIDGIAAQLILEEWMRKIIYSH